MSRLIITGAGGFLGSNLINGLIAGTYFDEIAAVTLGAEQMKNRFHGTAGLEIYEADAIASGDVVLRSEDLIVNCAYPRAMKGADVTRGLDYIETIFQEAAKASVRGLINISSQSVYDPQRDHPASETDMPALTDEYAVGKYCMEMLLRNLCEDIPYTNIRLASLIGPGFDARVPNKMARFALEKGEITAQVNNQRFGYLDVADAVRGLIGILQLPPAKWKPVYNLGAEKTYSLVEMAECIADTVRSITGKNVIIQKVQGDAELNTDLDSSLLISDIGQYCETSLEKSISQIVKHMLAEC